MNDMPQLKETIFQTKSNVFFSNRNKLPNASKQIFIPALFCVNMAILFHASPLHALAILFFKQDVVK